ncbi:VOC family protein [Croceicoccus gelatinilyticus]|uniref:VOC family protein n=1 Tax=Croceicoccus gelatinilyticus TaxID=2835536 RepID=UPI001BCDEBBA|nr:VOC family protein [Croceicoccus gelatinilyticus]MBS7668881.1 VOC family protein [Croceicoccus gelatinilyticus]
MPTANSIADLGPIMQQAYLPEDFDAAVKYWTETMGVGPFYMLENIRLGDMTCLGQPTDAVFTVAIAYWGDIQVELVRPENDAPAHYTGKYKVHDRLHHVCQVVDDIEDARKAVEAAGATIVVEGKVGEDGYVIYADPGFGAGGIVEFVQLGAGGPELFAMIKEASVNWDGSDPVRKLG